MNRPGGIRKILILCTGNSCRSIMAEALVNHTLGEKGITAFSAGSDPSGRVHPDAKAVLREAGAWRDGYHSKSIDEIMCEGPFELIVTVCGNAREYCPVLPGARRNIHVGFDDPDGHPRGAFVNTLRDMRERLLPRIMKEMRI
jgi:arsenate reductase